MKSKAKIALIFILVPLLLLFPTQVMAATVNDIASQVICQCGCTAVLNNCTNGECMVRDTMLNSIRLSLEQGKSPEQIIAFFVAQYGEQVLASPPKRGFNLTAWILPFVAIAFGGVVVYLLMKKWVLRGRENEFATDMPEHLEYGEYGDRVEKELAEFSERSFR